MPRACSAGGGGQWQRAIVSMLRKRTCILVSMSIPCQIWNGRSGVRGPHAAPGKSGTISPPTSSATDRDVPPAESPLSEAGDRPPVVMPADVADIWTPRLSPQVTSKYRFQAPAQCPLRPTQHHVRACDSHTNSSAPTHLLSSEMLGYCGAVQMEPSSKAFCKLLRAVQLRGSTKPLSLITR